MNGDVLPVSRGLVIALALGFGLFNEVLFSVLGAAILAQGRVDVGPRMVGIGVVVGAILFVVSFAFLVTSRSRHWTDMVAGIFAAGLCAWAVMRGVQHGMAGVAWPLLGANAWLAAWWSRGWLRRAIARQRNQA
jgi:hypothetical protein